MFFGVPYIWHFWKVPGVPGLEVPRINAKSFCDTLISGRKSLIFENFTQKVPKVLHLVYDPDC